MTGDREHESTMLTPDLDSLVDFAARGRWRESTSAQLGARLSRTVDLLDRIEPVRKGRDRRWSLWLRTARGALADFGDFDEWHEAGEVDSPEDLETLWRLEYPGEVQWHRLEVVAVDGALHFFFGTRLSFWADPESGEFHEIDVDDPDTWRLVAWILESSWAEIERFLRDPEGYNEEIARELPPELRFGRIRRRDLWKAIDGCYRYDGELDLEARRQLARIATEQDEDAILPEMTLELFLEHCEICYDANCYDHIRPDMSPLEKYRAMADGRDEGLLDLPQRDPEAFARWHRARTGGGHPFEICRGGNRTHISFYVVERPGGWQLMLSGLSDARCLETARAALALDERGKTFVLDRAAELSRMLDGEDFVGIVPEDIPLGYNRGDFPDEDRILSFAHLSMLQEEAPIPAGLIHWYPLEPLRPAGEP